MQVKINFKWLFIDAPGGTGKTSVLRAFGHYMRSRGEIILFTASSGIAAQNFVGGKTAHSRFHIPIPCH